MRKILYAEDNEGMRKMVHRFLTTAGFFVDAVSDGDEAIERAKLKKYDYILLDITMERVDGISAAKAISQSDNINRATAIIGLTGRTEAKEISACLEAGMSKVLNKPIDLDALIYVLSGGDDSDSEEDEQDVFDEAERSPPHVLDLEVLENYRKRAGPHAVEDVLRDFSKLWMLKIGEMYCSMVVNDKDFYLRAIEELAVLATAIGAGKVALFASEGEGDITLTEKFDLLPRLIVACNEVQNIINHISDNQKPTANAAANPAK